MLSVILMKILMWALALDLLAVGVLILFLLNARANMKREIIEQRFFAKAYYYAMHLESSEAAAEILNVSGDDFREFCKLKNIELPEDRIERKDRETREKEEQRQRILAEEAAWRAEQERAQEEQRKAQEDEARARKERLKKFGFR